MPCDTITRVELDIKNVDMDIMKAMLEGRGYSVTMMGENTLTFRGQSYSDNGTFNRKTGVITSRNNMDWVKVSYTTELVRQKTAKYGWNVKQISDTKFEVLKR